MSPHAARAAHAAPAPEGRRRRVRRSLVLLALLAAGFYFGFIVLTVVRATR